MNTHGGGLGKPAGPYSGGQQLDEATLGVIKASLEKAEMLQQLSPTARMIQVLEQIASRMAPPLHTWSIYPTDGLPEPVPAGRTELSFVEEQARLPNKTEKLYGFGANKQQSLIIVIDTWAKISVSPGPAAASSFYTGPAIIEAGARDIEKIEIEADVPYFLRAFVNTSVESADIRLWGAWTTRYHSSTLTKVAAADTDDDWTALAFIPRVGTKTIDQTLYGSANLVPLGYGQKMFLVRNAGDADINVRVTGAIIPEVGLVSGLIVDTDVGATTTVAADASAILETSLPWGLMRVEARVDKAEAADAEAAIEVEYISQAGIARAVS